MKVTLSLVDLDTIDCTADPHKTSFSDEKELLDIVLEVCRSDLVRKIGRITCYIDDVKYESDFYSDYEGDDREQITGEQAKKKKSYEIVR